MSVLPGLNLLKLSWSVLLQLHAWPCALITGRELGLRLHHLLKLLGDFAILELLAYESLVLLITTNGGVLTISDPLDKACIEQVSQGVVHSLLIQDFVLNLLVGFILLQDLVLKLLHLVLHGCMLFQLKVDFCLLELLLELVFFDFLPGPASFGIGYNQ